MTTYINGKQDAEFINPAIMDFFTLILQDTGQLDYRTLATTIPQWHDAAAISDSAGLRYILTRRPIPAKTVSTTANNYVTGTTTATSEATVISSFTAALEEKLFSRLNLNGIVRGQVVVGLTSSSASGTAYLSNVTVSLYKKTASGVETLLGSDTINVAASNATIIEVLYTLPFLMEMSGTYVDPTDVLYLKIVTTGYNSSSSYTTTHRIYFTRVSGQTLLEIQV